MAPPPLTPELLLNAYAAGYFPMGEARDDPRLFWVEPEFRAIFPLDRFHVPRRLARKLRAAPYEIRIDTAFGRVMEACAAPAPGRRATWINGPILDIYGRLHRMGHAHSVEAWQDGELVGGLYGVSLGAAFFGESMFSRARDASKIALVHLVARLRAGGFRLLDAQFMTEHLRQFGAVEIPQADYLVLLADATSRQADFTSLPIDTSPQLVLQSIAQTS
jgi:leucyl/phenylalanyl-tRNA--protein transferase